VTSALRSLLIDDEAPSRLRLRRLLSNHAEIDIAGEARDGLEAVEMIERQQPDLVFLDVEMPGLDGFEVLRAIAPSLAPPLVLFVTGHDQHALRAFQAQALAYLLKPVEQEQLDAMIDRACGIHRYLRQREEHRQQLQGVLDVAPQKLRRIVARKTGRLLLLDPADICFFWIDAGILRVRTEEQTFWTSYAISELETALSGHAFFRAHRSALVNLDQVAEIRPDVRSSFQLVMKDRERTLIEVSERQGRVLRSRIPGL
jgi:DNA-binding LytR/AlgR family response regulator